MKQVQTKPPIMDKVAHALEVETPRTDSVLSTMMGLDEPARSENLAILCRKLEQELRYVGAALDYQNERWGLYGTASQEALKLFKELN